MVHHQPETIARPLAAEAPVPSFQVLQPLPGQGGRIVLSSGAGLVPAVRTGEVGVGLMST